MKVYGGWGSKKARNNRARATRKPKIRWEVLGLQNPILASLKTSMEDIRQQVSSLARCRLEQDARSCTAERNAKATDQAPDSSNKRRRGATDSSRSS
jgi:hypothetical protein